jgi:hypothetical protein
MTVLFATIAVLALTTTAHGDDPIGRALAVDRQTHPAVVEKHDVKLK